MTTIINNIKNEIFNNNMETKYGFIKIVIENGKKKIDFDNCKFKKDSFFPFLSDAKLLKKITL